MPVIFLDISAISLYNLIRIFDCHRVVSESACLHIVRSWKMCERGLIFCFGGFMKKLTTYFSKGELALWGSSAGLILISFFLFDRVNFITLAASLIGTTSLIFNAKGNPIGQALMIVFSLLYALPI